MLTIILKNSYKSRTVHSQLVPGNSRLISSHISHDADTNGWQLIEQLAHLSWHGHKEVTAPPAPLITRTQSPEPKTWNSAGKVLLRLTMLLQAYMKIVEIDVMQIFDERVETSWTHLLLGLIDAFEEILFLLIVCSVLRIQFSNHLQAA